MQVDPKDITERMGVTFVQSQCASFGYIFREQNIGDYGIDAHIEIVESGQATGKIIAVQIKSGESYLKEANEERIVFRSDLNHLDYWLNHALPVLIVLYSPDKKMAYWQVIGDDTITRTKKAFKVDVPIRQTLTPEYKENLKALAYPKTKISNSTYKILSLQDISTGVCKRYSASILIPDSSTVNQTNTLIKSAIQDIKKREYYRNEMTKISFSGTPAKVVALFIYQDIADYKNTNWICRSVWTDPSSSHDLNTLKFDGDNLGDNIVVHWSDYHEFITDHYEQNSLSKEDYLERMSTLLIGVKTIVEKSVNLRKDKRSGSLSEKSYLERMISLEPEATQMYEDGTEIGLAPLECADVSQRFQNVIAHAHNIFIPFSKLGLDKWSQDSRDQLISGAIENYEKELVRLDFELEKIQ